MTTEANTDVTGAHPVRSSALLADDLRRDSLGGQNSHRRVSGARSIRALSAIFKQLRNADRRIAELDRWLAFETCNNRFWNCRATKLKQQRDKWDAKRKQLRARRKSANAKVSDHADSERGA